jgi:hypothetical protein
VRSPTTKKATWNLESRLLFNNLTSESKMDINANVSPNVSSSIKSENEKRN